MSGQSTGEIVCEGATDPTAGEQSPRVLIAEDDPLFRHLLQRWLLSWGYCVDVAEDGVQACDLLQARHAPGIAVLDWVMPGLTGLEVCRKIRQRTDVGYEYVVLVTAKRNPAEIVAGLEAGADDYVLKPFNPEELHARIRVGQRILKLQRDLLEAKDLLQQQATHDGLTGLWNRMAILQHLEAELLRSEREARTLALLMIDIDHFKSINDRYGHLAGDAVLKEVSRRIAAGMRRYDLLGRYGGEEFLAVMPNCHTEEAAGAAERIRGLVCESPVVANGEPIATSVSIGVALAEAAGLRAPNELLGSADAALYRAKSTGRNRVECVPAIVAAGYRDT